MPHRRSKTKKPTKRRMSKTMRGKILYKQKLRSSTRKRNKMRRMSIENDNGGIADDVLITHLLYKIKKRHNAASAAKAAKLASQAKQTSEAKRTGSISAKTTASSTTPGWGIGMPTAPEKIMQEPFNKWGAENRNISESGVIDTTRFQKFYIFLTEKLVANPKYVYALNDEYKSSNTFVEMRRTAAARSHTYRP